MSLRTNAALSGMMKSMVYVTTSLIKELDGAGYISKNKIIAILNERISSERLAINAAERQSVCGGFHRDREIHRYELRLLEDVVGTLLHVDPKPSGGSPERRSKSIHGGKSV